MNPRTITGVFLSVVVLLQVVSLNTVTQATQTRLDEQAKLTAVHDLDSKAKNLVIQAQQFLAPISTQLSISRQLIADGLLDTARDDVLELYFLSQLRTNGAMNALYLGRRDGSFVAVSRFERSLLEGYQKPVLRAKVVSVSGADRKIEWREYTLLGELLNQWHGDTNDYDPRLLEWYKNAQTHDQPVWTDTFSLVDSNQLAIAASVNLRNVSHKDAGVLGVSVALSELNAFLSAMPMSKLTSAVILDNNFNEVAASIPYSASLESGSADAGSKKPWTTASVQSKLKHLLPPIDVNGNRLSAVDRHWFSDHGTQVNVQRRIQLFDGALQWRIIMQAPVVEVEQSHKNVVLDGMYRTMAIIVLPGLLGLGIIIALSKPLGRLHRRATIDFLTRAFNREEFIQRFKKRLGDIRYVQGKRVQWLGVVLDLDGFKQINDQHGHDAGDDILKAVVARLQYCVGRTGFVGRLGGDEFVLALKLQPGSDARQTVEKIRREVIRQPIKSAKAVHCIGMTAGVALVSQNESVTDLLERADRALIAGKGLAKNATYLASEAASEQQVASLISEPVFRVMDQSNG